MKETKPEPVCLRCGMVKHMSIHLVGNGFFDHIFRPAAPKVEPVHSGGCLKCLDTGFTEASGFVDVCDHEAAVPDPKPSQEICQDCAQAYICWFAPNDVWNEVIPQRVGMLCPNCFLSRAERVGVTRDCWKLEPENWGVAKPVASPTIVIEIERETDGRWIADIPAISGVMAYGESRLEAVAKVLTLRDEVVPEQP